MIDANIRRAKASNDQEWMDELLEERQQADDDAASLHSWKYFIVKMEGVNSRHTRSSDPKTTYDTYFAFDSAGYHLNVAPAQVIPESYNLDQ